MERTYVAIDLKSFYASVECVERGLDPLTTHLVVADVSRTEKTICLAVTPALKAYGVSGRARLFEVVQKVSEINAQRRLPQGAAAVQIGDPGAVIHNGGRAGTQLRQELLHRTARPAGGHRKKPAFFNKMIDSRPVGLRKLPPAVQQRAVHIGQDPYPRKPLHWLTSRSLASNSVK